MPTTGLAACSESHLRLPTALLLSFPPPLPFPFCPGLPKGQAPHDSTFQGADDRLWLQRREGASLHYCRGSTLLGLETIYSHMEAQRS